VPKVRFRLDRRQAEADAQKECEKAASDRRSCLTSKLRGEYLAEMKRRGDTGRIEWFPDGKLMRVGPLPVWEEYETEGARGDRAKCAGFSARSRNALIRTVAEIRCDDPTLLGTLTYPGEFSKNPLDWKRDLDAWGKRAMRKYPGIAFVWKLEFQERGAPHYHLIIWNVAWVDKTWLARGWYEVVGSGEEDHRKAGTKIEAPRCEDAAFRYASKAYVQKGCDLPSYADGVGRFWGVVGRKFLPKSRYFCDEVPMWQLIKFRRIVSRWHRSCGRKKLGLGTQSVFGRSHLEWARVLDWSAGGEYATRATCPHVGAPFAHFWRMTPGSVSASAPSA
jgi:hypothetical protein